MTLFLLVSTTSFFLFLYEIYHLGKVEFKQKLKSLVYFLPLLAFSLFLQLVIMYNSVRIGAMDFEVSKLYSFFILRWDFLHIFLFVIWLAILIFVKKIKYSLRIEDFVFALIIYYSVMTFFDILSYLHVYDMAVLFIIPLIRFTYIILLIFLVEYFLKSKSILLFSLNSFLLLGVSLILPLYTVMYYRGFAFGAIILAMITFLITFLLLIFLKFVYKSNIYYTFLGKFKK
ncbi:MAG: hypothetical protein JXR63_09065 [Spirochaetales bacterium]|nr:hypothetical protein [Spirochaetales bacterium]